jgi:hypothetical protein
MISLLKKLFGMNEVQQTNELDRFRAMKTRSESVSDEIDREALFNRVRNQQVAQGDAAFLKNERSASPWNGKGDIAGRIYR